MYIAVIPNRSSPPRRLGAGAGDACRQSHAKARTKRTEDDRSVQSFQDWLEDLAMIVTNRIQPKLKSLPAFEAITRPTPAQQHALNLPGVLL